MRVGGNACRLETVGDLSLGQAEVSSQHFFDQAIAAGVHSVVDPQSPAAGQRAVGRPDAPGREPQHPSNILGRNQMPRRPHHMRPKNLAPLQRPVDGAQRGGPQPDSDSPADRLVVLCLNGSHPSHERTRIVEARIGQLLGRQTDSDQTIFHIVKGCSVSKTNLRRHPIRRIYHVCMRGRILKKSRYEIGRKSAKDKVVVDTPRPNHRRSSRFGIGRTNGKPDRSFRLPDQPSPRTVRSADKPTDGYFLIIRYEPPHQSRSGS